MGDSSRILRPSKRMGRISARTGKPVPEPETESKEGKSVFDAAERTAEFFDHLRAHHRKARRTPVQVGATITLLLEDGTVYDSGSAVILNISPSGALLSEVKVPGNNYPVQPFKLEILMKGGKYDGIGIEALPIRFEHKCGGIGVRFTEIFATV